MSFFTGFRSFSLVFARFLTCNVLFDANSCIWVIFREKNDILSFFRRFLVVLVVLRDFP